MHNRRTTHGRFFNYTDDAPDRFKEELEKSVAGFDSSSDATKYTPYASALLVTILGVLSNVFESLESKNENQTYEACLTAFQITIPIISAVAGFIIYVCKTANESYEKEVRELIAEGVRDRFFKSTPNFPATHNSDKELEEGLINHDLHIDAAMERIKKGQGFG